jgi:hypothetical protein
MKAIFSSFLALSFLLLSAFTQANSIDEVIDAMRTGNSTEMSKYFDDNLELTLPDKSDSYSRAQATLILKDFFSNKGVKGFDVKHKGDQGGDQFCIGTLQTQSGNFRTTVFMKTKASREVVRKIRFETIE